MKYRERFLNLCARTGIPSAISSEVWSVLESRYSEPHRHYHNLHHIESMLIKMDEAGVGGIGIELVIWFHDVVYDPKARDNEEQSSALFESVLGGHLDSDLTKNVVRLILATDHALQKTGMHDEDLMRDIEYRQYTSAIRKEYAHVADDEFRVGRSVVLEHFLARPVFTTGSFPSLETAARQNLESERNELISGKD